MRDTQLRVHLDEAIESAMRAAGQLASSLANMHDARNGWPTGSRFDGDRSTGHTTVVDEHGIPVPAVSDPTGEAAIAPDQAANDRAGVERAIKALYLEAERVLSLVKRYQPRRALPSERQSTAANDPGCWSCRRLKASDGERRWEPTHRRTDVNGKPLDLCRWCYDWHRSHGVLPATAELERHHRGDRVRRPA
jgi:hypothetical protein